MPLDHFSAFSAGALAACGAVTVTNPMEIIKIRLQLQGELLKADPSLKTLSAADTFMAVVRNEGLRGLQKALIPAYIYQILCNGVRLGMYENLANTIQSKLDVFTETPGSLQMLSKISSGAISGITGAFVASPLFLIKTRIQSYSEVVSKATFGHQHTDSKKGVWFMLKSIYKKDGIRGLWRGADASMVRTGIGSAVQLTTYDYFKRDLQTLQYFKKENKNGFEIHFCASLLSSFFVCLFMNPFDVASTRMYNQKTALIGSLYKNGFDCIIKTVKVEGISALYKGFSAHYLRIGPHTILTFVFLEQIKKIIQGF